MSERYKVISGGRNRAVYGLLMISTLLLGLGSRYFFGEIPFVKTYVGDMLWALMVYFGFALLFNKWPINVIALTTLVFSFSVEISQLYHPLWLDRLRATRIGGLILGFSFVWSDLLCYTVGVLVGLLIDMYSSPTSYQGGPANEVR